MEKPKMIPDEVWQILVEYAVIGMKAAGPSDPLLSESLRKYLDARVRLNNAQAEERQALMELEKVVVPKKKGRGFYGGQVFPQD